MGEHEKRIRAIQALLIEKGIVTANELRQKEEVMDAIGPTLGAKVVAKAWVNPAFKARLLADAKTAITELDIEPDPMTTLVAVDNRENLHNVVVCTLCSCYPRTLLGLPPAWYKSLEYRSRVVSEPRGVLQEFGLELDPSVEVRVLRQHGGHPLRGDPRAPGGYGGHDRGGASGTRDARQHDWRGQGERTGVP